MSGYIEFPLESDPDVILTRMLEELSTNLTGWVPREGHLEIAMLEVLSRRISETLVMASLVPKSIFRFFGESIVGIVPVVGAKATTTTTWTMINNAGYTIPEGTAVAFRIAGDTIRVFRTVEAVIVPPGQTATVAGEVVIESQDEGTALNGLPAGTLELIDSLAFVSAVASTAVTTGGVNPETDDAYLDRLSAELALLTPRPILPEDFAVLARRVAGVYRATAIDGYNPGDQTYNNDRMVTVAVVGESGEALSTNVKNMVDALLESEREVNFVVHVVDPTYVAITIVFTAVAAAGWDSEDVEDRAIAALYTYLDPGLWGGGGENPPVWRSQNVVRYLEIASVLNAVPGLDYITALTINGGTANVTMTGAVPLPASAEHLTTPTTVSGTVT